METREAFRYRIRYTQHLAARLRLATTRRSRNGSGPSWRPIRLGLSIRQIATATGLSRGCLHQLLQDDEASEIPTWLSPLRAHDHLDASEQDAAPSPAHAWMQTRVAEEVEV